MFILQEAKENAAWLSLSTDDQAIYLRRETENHGPLIQLAAIGMAIVSLLAAATRRDLECFAICLANATTSVIFIHVARQRCHQAEAQILKLGEHTRLRDAGRDKSKEDREGDRCGLEAK